MTSPWIAAISIRSRRDALDMSDVVAVAAITGAVGLASNALTYRLTKSQGRQNVEIARRQGQVELEKSQAETERLRGGYREAERRNRQGTYHEFIQIATVLYQRFGNPPGPVDEFNALIDRYNELYAGVMLFAPEPVRDAMARANEIFIATIGEGHSKTQMLLKGEDPDTWWREKGAPIWIEVSSPRKESFHEALGLLNEEMRKDITADVLRPAT